MTNEDLVGLGGLEGLTTTSLRAEGRSDLPSAAKLACMCIYVCVRMSVYVYVGVRVYERASVFIQRPCAHACLRHCSRRC